MPTASRRSTACRSGGKVRTSTAAGPHDGLGVAQYMWASSPLRRYVDLVNQRQLIARARGEPPVYRAQDTALLAAMRDFETAYEIYGEYQRTMERYWSLRWLLQEKAATVTGVVLARKPGAAGRAAGHAARAIVARGGARSAGRTRGRGGGPAGTDRASGLQNAVGPGIKSVIADIHPKPRVCFKQNS